MSSTKAIPPSVLALLRHQWQEPELENGAFEQVFSRYPHRRTDPSYYHHTPHDDGSTCGACGVPAKEMLALTKAGVFREMARLAESGGSVVVNEHAQHAVFDFCESVYAAWKVCQERLDIAERACPRSRYHYHNGEAE